MAFEELVYKVATEVLGEDVFDEFADHYETRLLLQKTMFVFQESAKKDLFGYSWYLAGPYSPAITNIAYKSIIPNMENNKEEWEKLEFSENGLACVKDVKSFLAFSKEDEFEARLGKAGFFELMASMLYMSKYGDNISTVTENLEKTKGKKFTKEVIRAFVPKYWKRLENIL